MDRRRTGHQERMRDKKRRVYHGHSGHGHARARRDGLLCGMEQSTYRGDLCKLTQPKDLVDDELERIHAGAAMFDLVMEMRTSRQPGATNRPNHIPAFDGLSVPDL
jgi:hypothetical protein